MASDHLHTTAEHPETKAGGQAEVPKCGERNTCRYNGEQVRALDQAHNWASQFPA